MKISYKNFLAQLTGARLCDEHRWVGLNQERALWEIFAFDDDGAYYLNPQQRNVFRAVDFLDRKLSELDWGAEVKDDPNYHEPKSFVIQ